MKNRLIIIGLIFSIVFQTFGIPVNDIVTKNSTKTCFHSNKKAKISLILKSLFLEEETEEDADDEPDSKTITSANSSRFFQFILAEKEPVFCISKSKSNKFSVPIYLFFRNLRI